MHPAAKPIAPAELRPFLQPCLPLIDHGAVVVGVSGGPDSMALCRLLSDLTMDGTISQVHAVTVDHGLRAESAAEAQAVGQQIQHWPNIQHHILTRTDPGATTRIQERARTDRHRLLQDFCRDHGAGALFLAHHADDQAETLLMRLSKGSGVDGLAGMRTITRSDHGVPVIRPCLGFAKERLIATCRHYAIAFIDDPSNHNPVFARGRLRRVAAELANEGLSSENLSLTAKRVAHAAESLKYFADRCWENIAFVGSERIELNLIEWRQLPFDMRLRLLRRAVEGFRGSQPYPVRTSALETLVDLLSSGMPARRTLAGCLIHSDPAQNRLTIAPEVSAEGEKRVS